MSDERMKDFLLAGGTNLSLQLGHRQSIDLDLFSYKPFDSTSLAEYLTQKYKLIVSDVRSENSLKGLINGVKVDIIAHVYPLIESPVIENSIRMYSINDITAMKLAAISDNGTRLKDFVDIAYISTVLSLSNMLNAYMDKYKNGNQLHVLRGLTYFDEIDFDVTIGLTSNHKFSWKRIKERIFQMVKNEDKIFENEP